MNNVTKHFAKLKERSDWGAWSSRVSRVLRHNFHYRNTSLVVDYSYWTERIIVELEYALRISAMRNGEFDALIDEAVGLVAAKLEEEGAITRDTVSRTEAMLSVVSGAAKELTVLCVGHAHIDMNWQWGLPETVSITLETFRTVLQLMDEYPDFKFSQSQAAMFRLVEEYEPEMIPKIKQRVQEGRWELTASQWVEGDKNLISGESLARHILYTKRYLTALFDIPEESIDYCFEPDTFGHNLNLPEILADGGIKYYYFARGSDESHIFRWQAPSGRSVIAYREPRSYGLEAEATMMLYAADFCQKYDTDTAMNVYGVSDHGGGPTRRDLERIIDIGSWPIAPAVRFATHREFFRKLESMGDRLPVLSGELNVIFTGCYTSSSRIKMANRLGDVALKEAETFKCISAINGLSEYGAKNFEEAWKNNLFLHFHDILPGCGVIETREYSLGKFQETMSRALIEKAKALRLIAGQIDTSRWAVDEDISSTTSEGAGVGYGIDVNNAPAVSRGAGRRRLFNVFNPSPFPRQEIIELVVFDWDGDINRITFTDDSGEAVPHQVLDGGFDYYWNHSRLRLLADVRVPALGYRTLILDDSYVKNRQRDFHMPVTIMEGGEASTTRELKPRFVLENSKVKVSFDELTMAMTSLVDKSTGDEHINADGVGATFRFIREDGARGDAWTLNRHERVTPLVSDIKVTAVNNGEGQLKQWIDYNVPFAGSEMTVRVSLMAGASCLEYDLVCQWREFGTSTVIPHLGYSLPLSRKTEEFCYDIPCGTIRREPANFDVPSCSFIAAVTPDADAKAVILATRTKYGFRAFDNAVAVSLIRASARPDKYPENYEHTFQFAVILTDNSKNQTMIRATNCFCHPLSFVSTKAHPGTMPATASFFSLEEGTVVIEAVKCPEEAGNEMLIRLYETEGTVTKVMMKFNFAVTAAQFVDVNEHPVAGEIAVNENRISFAVNPWRMVSVKVF